MLEEIFGHVGRGVSFAFETTLSGKGYARLIPRWQADGYLVHLVFLSLSSPELAIERVRKRVSEGGHNIAEPVIRRRYVSGLLYFEKLYQPLVNRWSFYDNSFGQPVLMEEGENQ